MFGLWRVVTEPKVLSTEFALAAGNENVGIDG